MTALKVLTLHQPHATLIALGIKTIETRTRPAPKTLIGERIAIHAAKKPCATNLWLGDSYTAQDGTWIHSCTDRHPSVPLPLGAIVATATLTASLPMVGPHHQRTEVAHLIRVGSTSAVIERRQQYTEARISTDITDQLPYGDFTPGRHGWLLTDIEPLTRPEPFRGGQGLGRSWTPT